MEISTNNADETWSEAAAYFRCGQDQNPKFWSRFGGRPDFTGQRVLDVGCGHGSLCVDMAEAGAAGVVGLDIDSRRLAFAQDNLRRHYPHLLDRVTLVAEVLEDHDDPEGFDAIVSKDAFEHILDVPTTLRHMWDRLRPGGKVYAGFGPLYHSPFGDHGRTRLRVPWAHVVVPERWIVARLNRSRRNAIRSIQDLGLNMHRLSHFRKMFQAAGFRITFFRVNQSRRVLMRLGRITARVLPPLADLLAHNLYCVLERP